MSLPDPRRGRSRSSRCSVLGLAVAVAVSGTLAGCGTEGGFRPLYLNSRTGEGVDRCLAQMEYPLLQGRVGQRLRNELLFNATGGGELITPPTYRLEIVIRESVTSTLVKTDGDSLGQIYQLDAAFRIISLKDKENKKVVFSGTSFGRAAFERFQPIFSNIRAREDAENRASKSVADELKVRLAAFFSQGC